MVETLKNCVADDGKVHLIMDFIQNIETGEIETMVSACYEYQHPTPTYTQDALTCETCAEHSRQLKSGGWDGRPMSGLFKA